MLELSGRSFLKRAGQLLCVIAVLTTIAYLLLPSPTLECTNNSSKVFEPTPDTHVVHLDLNQNVIETPTHFFHYMEDVMSLRPSLAQRMRRRSPCLFVVSIEPLLFSPLQLSNLQLLASNAGCLQIAFVVVDLVAMTTAATQQSSQIKASTDDGKDEDDIQVVIQINPDHKRILRVDAETTAYVLQHDGMSLVCHPMARGTWKIHRWIPTSARVQRTSWMLSNDWLRLTTYAGLFCNATKSGISRNNNDDDRQQPPKTLIINRTTNRRLVLQTHCRDENLMEIEEESLLDSSHICHYVQLMKSSERIIFPHGYTGTLLLYANPEHIIDEFYPCNYYKPAYMKFRAFTTYNHTQHQCECYDLWHYLPAQFIDPTECMQSHYCRSYFRHQDILMRCPLASESKSRNGHLRFVC